MANKLRDVIFALQQGWKIDGDDIEASGVETANIADDAVTTDKIVNAAVTPAKISSGVSGTLVGFFPSGAQQAINANGAITTTQYSTAITSVTTTGVTFTLADATVVGQIKRMQLVADGGSDAVVTFNTNATLTFADVGDVAEVIWNGSDWLPIALYNCASGDVGPAYVAAS